MHLKASSSFIELVTAAESSLNKLEYRFIRNESSELVEFEITAPAYFRVVIEPRKDPEVHNFILPSIKKASGSTVDLRFALDAGEHDLKVSNEIALRFLQRLVDSLSTKPWEGLRMRESGRERKRWKSALN
ncbi:MAG: hypothetical protein ACYC7D_11160 [Nitrososphaerales archaeon]